MKFGDYLTEATGQVGKTILSQIRAIDKWSLQAWGAKDFVSNQDGIQFDVRGSKHRGRVIIALNKKDLYNIEIGKIVKKKGTMDWKSIKKVTDIGVENLVTALDGLIG